MSGSVEYAAEGSVATLWLRGAGRHNAYDLPLLASLRAGLRRADAEPEIRAIVIRGRGESFCAGADFSLLSSGGSWVELSRAVAGTFDAVSNARKVTIAAVHGYAVGGGFELMLACDLAVAAEDAQIGDGHIRHGLFGSAGSPHRLARVVGVRRAREMLLSGELLGGGDALAWGLVNAVAPAPELDAAVAAFAARFTDKSPTATWLTKLAAGQSLEAGADTLAVLGQVTGGVFEHLPDAAEGIEALRNHRPPNWRPLPPPAGDE